MICTTVLRRPELFALLIGLALGVPALAQGPATVYVGTVVEQKQVIGGQTFVGTVEPLRRSVVGSAVSGRVIELKVNDGDRVTKDQPLAQLLTRQLEIQIAVARADRDLRAEELRELENGSRPEEIRQAEAQMFAAKSVHEYAQSKLTRTRGLFDRKVGSEDEMLDAVRASTAAEKTLIAAEAQLALVKAGPRQERIAQARARLLGAEEEVNRLLDQLEKHTIKAPFDGYVVKEHTEKGQWIMSGAAVVEVIDVDEIELIVQVPELFVARLQLNAAARIEITALPHTVFTGQVTHIVPQADVRSRNFPVIVQLKNQRLPDGQVLIRPGMFCRVTLPVEMKASVMAVSKDALVLGGPEPLVYVIDNDLLDPTKKRARAVPVKAGVAFGSLVEVIGDLKIGQTIVIEGNERLRGGQDVIIATGKIGVGDKPK